MKNIRPVVHLALVLAQRQARGVPAVGRQTRAVGQRQPGVVAQLGPGNAIRLILVIPRTPLADQAHLGPRGRGGGQHRPNGKARKARTLRHIRHRDSYPPNPIHRPPQATANQSDTDTSATAFCASPDTRCSSASATFLRTVNVKIITTMSELILIQNAGLP